MQVSYWENLKLKKNKHHFRCTNIPFSGEVISREGVQPDIKKLCAARHQEAVCNNRDVPSTNNTELQSLLGIMNYLGRFSPSTAEACEPLRKSYQ